MVDGRWHIPEVEGTDRPGIKVLKNPVGVKYF